jgi:peptide deformylase
MKKTELQIQLYGSPILARKCRKVTEINDEIRALLHDMLVLMRESDGIGLAANQAGIDACLVVIELSGKVYKMINPRIVASSGKVVFEEGCLSFPGLELDVRRAAEVTVRYIDEMGVERELRAVDLLAIALQHETDHISGKTFVDRVSMARRAKIRKQLEEIRKQARALGQC